MGIHWWWCEEYLISLVLVIQINTMLPVVGDTVETLRGRMETLNRDSQGEGGNTIHYTEGE